MKSCEITMKYSEGIPVFFVKGYFTDYAGKDLANLIDPFLKEGKAFFIVDFSECNLVNSPGLVSLVNLSTVVSDDFQGKVILTGLDEFKISVMTIAGVFYSAEQASTLEEAVKRLKT